MITYRYTSAFARRDFDRNDSTDKADAVPQFHLTLAGENNATRKAYGKG